MTVYGVRDSFGDWRGGTAWIGEATEMAQWTADFTCGLVSLVKSQKGQSEEVLSIYYPQPAEVGK